MEDSATTNLTTTATATTVYPASFNTPSVLIIGASGRMGLALIRSISTRNLAMVTGVDVLRPNAAADDVKVHAFVRAPAKLRRCSEARFCTSVQEGDARSPEDLRHAVEAVDPSHIVICVGETDSLRQTDIRESCAIALSSALRDSGYHATVRIVVVSAQGSDNSRIRYWIPFVGGIIQFVLRHQLDDHTKQEDVLRSTFDYDLHLSRLLVVRPMGLHQSNSRRRFAVLQLKHNQRSPTLTVHRDDLADWIVARICGPQTLFGGAVTITGVNKY